MIHAGLKIKRFKKKSKPTSSSNSATVQKDDEYLGNLLKRTTQSPGILKPRISVALQDPFDLDDPDFDFAR